MSATLEFTLSIKKDGELLPESFIIKRLTVDEIQSFNYEQVAHGDAVTFTALPAGEIATINALILRSDKVVTLRLDGQSDAGIEIKAGGMIILTDVTIDAGAGASNAKLNNNSGGTAILKGFVAGT